jgi:hypothetical protein
LWQRNIFFAIVTPRSTAVAMVTLWEQDQNVCKIRKMLRCDVGWLTHRTGCGERTTETGIMNYRNRHVWSTEIGTYELQKRVSMIYRHRRVWTTETRTFEVINGYQLDATLQYFISCMSDSQHVSGALSPFIRRLQIWLHMQHLVR